MGEDSVKFVAGEFSQMIVSEDSDSRRAACSDQLTNKTPVKIGNVLFLQ